MAETLYLVVVVSGDSRSVHLANRLEALYENWRVFHLSDNPVGLKILKVPMGRSVGSHYFDLEVTGEVSL